MPFAAGEALALKLAARAKSGSSPSKRRRPDHGRRPRNQELGLGPGPLQPVFLVDWNDFGIDERPASSVVHGTPQDWFAPYGWRVTGTPNGMEWGPTTRTVLEASRGLNPRTPQRGRGSAREKVVATARSMPPATAPRTSSTPLSSGPCARSSWPATTSSIRAWTEPAPADPTALAAQAEANFRVAMSVMRSDDGLVDWLSDRLLEIAATVPDQIEGCRLGASAASAPAADPSADKAIFDFENYPETMWRKPGDRQPNRAALATWGSYVNAIARRDFGRPLSSPVRPTSPIDQHRRLR